MLAKGKLDSEGLESFLADDNTVRMDWLWSNLLGGIKLLVDPEDAELRRVKVSTSRFQNTSISKGLRIISNLVVQDASHLISILRSYTNR